jgi:hypothetical protein
LKLERLTASEEMLAEEMAGEAGTENRPPDINELMSGGVLRAAPSWSLHGNILQCIPGRDCEAVLRRELLARSVGVVADCAWFTEFPCYTV